jgi:acetylornithine deacetylase
VADPVGENGAVARPIDRDRMRLGAPYGADMRPFVNVGHTPCAIFGPGDVRQAHSADEHVSLAEVEACAGILAAWVRSELLA